jgi:D-tyrosyl-tRNA(Tyr) deacylase
VTVGGCETGAIGPGLVLLVGFGQDDTEDELAFWADKCIHLRVFPDSEGKLNRSLTDVNGEVLAISQFTLYGDVKKGRRPSFTGAARPDIAEALYDRFVSMLREHGVRVRTGRFGAMMEVEIHNSGPVTLILER